MRTLTWLPGLLGGPAAVAGAQTSHADWSLIIAGVGVVATLIAAVTGLVVALRRHETSVIVISPERAEELGLLGDNDGKPSKRRRRLR